MKKILKFGVIGFILLIIIGAIFGGKEEPKNITYTEVTMDELMNVWEGNAAKAKKEYDGKYLEVSGIVNNIDSNCKYIDIVGTNEFAIIGMQINFDSKYKEAVSNLENGSSYTFKVKVTDVGEVFGYYADYVGE